MKLYNHTRLYTKDELANDIGEYFENEYTLKNFPGLAKNKKELAEKILKAPKVVLTKQQLLQMANSEVRDVMKSSDPDKILEKIAKEYNRDVKSIKDAFKNKKQFPMPIVIKSSSGYYLMSGNTRLCVLASMGSTMPVKENM